MPLRRLLQARRAASGGVDCAAPTALLLGAGGAAAAAAYALAQVHAHLLVWNRTEDKVCGSQGGGSERGSMGPHVPVSLSVCVWFMYMC